MSETWCMIMSLPEYEASSKGRVRRIPWEGPMPNGGVRTYGGKAWTGTWDQVERRYVMQFRGKTYRIARLVCEAFHGKPPFAKADTMHLDEDGRHNDPSNLIWGTRQENLNFPKVKAYHSRVCRAKMAGLLVLF